MKPHYPQIVCKDGAYVSVQASKSHYCLPRNDQGPYTEVEAGFPSVEPPASWLPYADEPDRPTQTIYSYMPVDRIEEFVAAHGGLDWGKMLTQHNNFLK